MTNSPSELRSRVRAILIIVIIMASMCYCVGIATWQISGSQHRPTATPTQENTLTPLISETPSITPQVLFTATRGASPTSTTTGTSTMVPTFFTFTPITPSPTHTQTPVPPSATNTSIPPSQTFTPFPPTNTPLPPTDTASPTITDTPATNP